LKANFKYGELHLGNAKELIKKVKDNSIDLIFTDPPYGLGFGEYDNDEDFYSLEEELWRVAKPNSWLVFYWTTKKLLSVSRLRRFQYVWQIICYFPSTYSKSILGDRKYAPIFVFKKGNPKMKDKDTDFIYAFELPCVVEKVKNQLFKPTVVNMQILKMFSQKGDLILDPFAGFGSIPLVCELFERKWVGFEIDKRCYNLACRFIKERKVTTIGKLEGKRGRIQMDLF